MSSSDPTSTAPTAASEAVEIPAAAGGVAEMDPVMEAVETQSPPPPTAVPLPLIPPAVTTQPDPTAAPPQPVLNDPSGGTQEIKQVDLSAAVADAVAASAEASTQPLPDTKPADPTAATTTEASTGSTAQNPGIVWRLQYIPTVLVPTEEGGGEAGASATPAAGTEGTAAATTTQSLVLQTPSGQPQLPPGQVAYQVQVQSPDGPTSQAYLVAPPNFAASLGSGQNITIALPGPQARVSNDPNHAVFKLDLSDDPTNISLPLPLEEEVDLSTYSYHIKLGYDVVSGKGGKVQQLNRHFRNMVASAYPTYDSTSSKITKRKIGMKIYQAIIDRGGRFLDIEGKAMDRPKSILKVMKALKDAKTWTSDAKRLAKRKRDEQKTLSDSKDAKKPRVLEPLADLIIKTPVGEDGKPIADETMAAPTSPVAARNLPIMKPIKDETDGDKAVAEAEAKEDAATPAEKEDAPAVKDETIDTKDEPEGETAGAAAAKAQEENDAAAGADSVLEGLELLTKAAADARDTDDKQKKTAI